MGLCWAFALAQTPLGLVTLFAIEVGSVFF